MFWIILTNIDQYIYVSAISEINDNTFSPDIRHEIRQKTVLSFDAIQTGVNDPRIFKQDIPYTVRIGTQISIFPTIPPGVNANIYVRNADDYRNNGGQAYGDRFPDNPNIVTMVQDVDLGYAAVIDGNSRYKIYTLVANDVVKRLIFKIISIDTATCKIQGDRTTIEGTIRNVNTVSVNVNDERNGNITQLKSGVLPDPNEFSISYKNNDNSRRYYVNGVGDNAVDTTYASNPVQNCEVLAAAGPDCKKFLESISSKTKKFIEKSISDGTIDQYIENLNTLYESEEFDKEIGKLHMLSITSDFRQVEDLNKFIACLKRVVDDIKLEILAKEAEKAKKTAQKETEKAKKTAEKETEKAKKDESTKGSKK